MRNGAWQPLACTRLPECNFPVITLPNFSASVKDHLVTQHSQACAGREARPSLRIIFNRQRKHIRSFLSGMYNVPTRQARGPAVAPTSPVSRRLPRRHPRTHSLALPTHHQPHVSAAHLSPIAVSLTATTHKVIHLNPYQPGLSVTHGDMYRVTYAVTPPASQPLQLHLLKPPLAQVLP